MVLLFGGLAHICVSRHVGVMKENKRGIRSGCRMDWFWCQINLVGVVDEAVGSN